MQNVSMHSHPELRSLNSSLLKFSGDQTKRPIKLYQATENKQQKKQKKNSNVRESERELERKINLQQTHFSQIVN